MDNNTGRFELQIRSGSIERGLVVVVGLGFDPKYPPIKMVTLTDINGNGSDEVAVLGRHQGGFNQKVWVKDGKTNRSLKQIFFDRNFVGQDLDVSADLNGNGVQELVVLGKRESDGKLRAIIKDAKTRELIARINF